MSSSEDVAPDRATTDRPGCPGWMAIALPALAVALFVSWLVPPTRVLWDAVDRDVFFALNATLNWGHVWVEFWAFANTRWFDLVVAAGFAGFFLWYCLEKRGAQTPARLAEILLLMITLVIVRTIAGVILDMISYKRASPTLVFDDVLMLSELSDRPRVKDSSAFSFPGDHALVSLWIGLYFWFFATWRFKIIATVLVIVSTIPRLISGAHSLTDVVVGSMCMALFAFGLVVGTRIFGAGRRLLTPISTRLGNIAIRILYGREFIHPLRKA